MGCKVGIICENPLTLWFTGLSGSGKTTVSKRLESKLISSGYLVARLDGDEMRSGLNSDLGFERWERRENVRRIAEVAKLMNKIGITVLIAVISPYENDRKMAREIIGESFVEVYMKTNLEECIKRDVKGLYKMVQQGCLAKFTGIDSSYEVPQNPDILIDTQLEDIESESIKLLRYVKENRPLKNNI